MGVGVKHFTGRAMARLDRVLNWLGPVPATIALSVPVVLAVFGIHLVLKAIEGEAVTRAAMINVPVETFLVCAPLIFYARRVIAKLASSRAQLQAMSDRLSLSVEEAQASSKAKSAFLANMSHELRTPLNAILGFSEIMKDQHLGPVSNARYLNYAADIHSSGRHLLGIINDVLDLAKIESGKMTLEDATEFPLAPALTDTLHMLAGLGEKKGVTVRGEWGNGEIRLIAVQRMVRQIVINLVGNAIKFTPEGGSVTLSGARKEDGSFALVIHDTGIGMTQEEIINALTPFAQNSSRKMGAQEGTGLGLPLAKAMIELHGGSLTLASKPNRGTWVTLIFPAERVVSTPDRAAA